MQHSKYLLIQALIYLNLTVGFAQPNKSPEALIQSWEKMWNTYDLAQVDHLFLPDQSVTYFSSEYAGVIRGIESLRTHHEKFGFVIGGKPSGNKLWLENVSYEHTGQICLVTATWYFQRNGSDQRQAGPVTFMLVHSKGDWRISHAHFSNNP